MTVILEEKKLVDCLSNTFKQCYVIGIPSLPQVRREKRKEAGLGRKKTSLQKEETIIYNIVKIDVIQALIE